jgi:O-antigen/teichoic acid export membrane protein
MLTENLEQQVVKNSLTQGLQLFASLLVTLSLPPVIIFFIGVKNFGIWVLIQAISQLANLFNLSIQPALAKYVAEYRTRNAYDEIDQIATAAVTVCCLASLFILLGFFLGKDYLIPFFFRSSSQGPRRLGLLVLSTLLVTAFNLFNQIFLAILNGFQRMDWSNYIAAVGFVINGVASIALLWVAPSVWALVGALALSTLFLTVASYRYVNLLMPTRSLHFLEWRLINTKAIRKLLTLSSSAIMIAAVTTGWGSAVRLLLGSYAGIVAVAFYDLAQRVRTQLQIFPLVVIAPLGPAVSELESSRGIEYARDMVVHTIRLIQYVTAPMFVFCIVLAGPLVGAWLGNGYQGVAVCIQIFALATYPTVINGPAYNSLIGLGRPLPGIRFSLISLAINSTVTVLLVMKFKLMGAVVGESLALFSAATYFYVDSHRIMGIAFSKLKSLILPPVLGSAAISPLALLMSWVATRAGLSSHLATWVFIYAIFAAFLYGTLWKCKFLGRSDLLFVKGIVTMFMQRAKNPKPGRG